MLASDSCGETHDRRGLGKREREKTHDEVAHHRFIVGTIFAGTNGAGPGRWLDGRGLGLGAFRWLGRAANGTASPHVTTRVPIHDSQEGSS
jgi:hypothetical protein